MKNSYKILIIGGYDFDGTNATSITLKSLLGFLKEEQIAFLYTTSINHSSKYKNITILQKHFSNISNKKIVKELSKSRSDVAGTTKTTGSIAQNISNIIHSVGSAYRSIIKYKLDNNTKNFIDDFKPDFIYSLLANVAIMDLCLQISKRNNIPIIPHFMDDWPHVMFGNNPLLSPARILLKQKLKKVLERSPFGLGISPKMCNEYSLEYHKDFYPFMNSCIDMFREYMLTNEREFRITYIGGLHLNRISSIIHFCNIINAIKDIDVNLSIYTSENNWNKYGNSLNNYKFLKYRGFVNNKNISAVYAKSDILLHVESFDNEIKNYTRLSISTKIPEYLSSGKLIIAIGPKDIASIEYLSENEAALVLNDRNEYENMKKIMNTLNNKEIIYQYIKNARALYIKNHKQTEQRNIINNLFCSLIN